MLEVDLLVNIRFDLRVSYQAEESLSESRHTVAWGVWSWAQNGTAFSFWVPTLMYWQGLCGKLCSENCETIAENNVALQRLPSPAVEWQHLDTRLPALTCPNFLFCMWWNWGLERFKKLWRNLAATMIKPQWTPGSPNCWSRAFSTAHTPSLGCE